MPKRSNQRRSGKTGKSVTTALTQSEVWDRKLAMARDVCHVQQRLNLASGVGTTETNYLPIASGSTSTLGVRLSDLAFCFTHWRINRCLLRLLPTAAGVCTVGFVDDPDATTQPTNAAAINDLRISRSFSTFLTDSGAWELEWTPLDKRQWYFTEISPSTSAADFRLVSPFQIFAIGGTANMANMQVYLDISFEGATDPTTTG